MWLKTTKDLDWFKRNLHQDYILPFNQIHDEYDLGIDSFLFESISIKLAIMAQRKDIFDKFGYPYINSYFDLEYDDTNSWTSTKTIKFDARLYSEKDEDFEEEKVLVLDYIDETQIEGLANLEDGDVQIKIRREGNIFNYPRLVKY